MNCTLKDVSIVIVTYKGDGLLKNCLDSLKASCGADPQIVVVDNSPTERTRFLVAEYPNTLYVSSPGNPGFAGGNNRALPFCDRPFILLLNNDTLVNDRSSIEQLVAFMQDNPRAGAIQGTMVAPRDKARPYGCGTFISPFGFLYSRSMYSHDSMDVSAPFKCFSCIGAFMMIRRSILRHTGGFLFRSHFWAYYEEIDFCHRIWLSGHEVWYVPTTPIVHIGYQTADLFTHVEIMGRYLRNQLFSLAVNLGAISRLWMLPCQAFVVCTHSIICFFRGNREMAASDLRAVTSLWRERKRIIAARRPVKRLRKVSDYRVFKEVMRMPSLNYILRSLNAIG